MKLVIGFIILAAVVFSVYYYRSRHPGKKRIIELVNSKNVCDRMKGFLAIGRTKNTTLYKLFFQNRIDQNISHCFANYGKSVLWAKIESLKKITGITPPGNYNPMQPDTSLLRFYEKLIYP